MKKNFCVTTDTCADYFASEYKKLDIPFVHVKRVLNGEEIFEVYDSQEEYDAFYESLKTERPTTAATNETEFEEFFTKVLAEREGDIVHVCLSSGLSLTYDNALKAVENMKDKLGSRKIHIVDSLIATAGMAMQVEHLIELRDKGVATEEAVASVINLRDHQQGWIVVSDLFHLKRGGRISGVKAMLGTVLGMKPILHVAKSGKVVIENKKMGVKKSVAYIMDKIKELGEKAKEKFVESPLYIIRTTICDAYIELKKAIKEKYPTIKIKEGIIGPTLGTHSGPSACCVLWQGAPRLDIK